MSDIPAPVREFIEDNLLTSSGYRDRRALSDALGVPGVTQEALDSLVNRRLLRQEPANGVIWLELTHDLLTGVVQLSRAQRRQRRAEEQHLIEQREAEAGRLKAELELIRSKKELSRSKRTVALVTGLTVVALVFLIFSVQQWGKANEAVRISNDQAHKSQAAKLKAEAASYVASNALELVHQKTVEASREDQATAEEMFNQGEWAQGLAYLGHALFLDPTNDNAAIHLWSAVVYGRRGDGRLPEFFFTNSSPATLAVLDSTGTRACISTATNTFIKSTLNGAQASVLTDVRPRLVAFSPGGESLLTVSVGGIIETWDVETGRHKLTLEHAPRRPLVALFSPDGQSIVATGLDGTNVIWDVSNSEPRAVLTSTNSGWASVAAFSPDGKYVAAGGQDRIVWIWNASNGELKSALGGTNGHEGWITGAAFSPDGRMIVTTSYDKTALIWDWANTNLVAPPLRHDGRIQTAAFNFDTNRPLVITASADGTACIWNATNGLLMTAPLKHKTRVVTAMFSTNLDVPTALTTAADNSVHLWDVLKGTPLGEPYQHGRTNTLLAAKFLNGSNSNVVTAGVSGIAIWNAMTNHPGKLLQHRLKVWSARFSPDGARVVTANQDGIARVWDVNAPAGSKPILSLTNGLSKVVAVRYAEYSPDGKLIVTASEGSVARVWDATSGKLVSELKGHKKAVRTAYFDVNSDRVVTSSLDGTARVFSTNGTLIAGPLEHTNGVLSALFNPDGSKVVTASLDATAKIWDSSTGEKTGSFENDDDVYYASFSSDGSNIVTCSGSVARIWDANDSKKPPFVLKHSSRVLMARFGPANAANKYMVVTACGDGTVGFWKDWRTNSPRSSGQTARHGDQVNSVEFSPDGKFVVSSSADGTARLWEIVNGRLISFCEPFPHQGEVAQAAFSPQGVYIATASEDGTAGIWKQPPRILWGYSMTNLITANATNFFPRREGRTNGPVARSGGEILTEAISGYRFDPASGELRQLDLNQRLSYIDVLTNRPNDEWKQLLEWWKKSWDGSPRGPWPDSLN